MNKAQTATPRTVARDVTTLEILDLSFENPLRKPISSRITAQAINKRLAQGKSLVVSNQTKMK
jgi:hypothetical protein